MITRKALKLWLSISLLGLAVMVGMAVSYAQSDSQPAPVILTDGQEQYALGRHLELFEDSTGQLTIAEVAAPEFAARFAPSSSAEPAFGRTSSAIWARLRLRNQTTDAADWLLEVEQFQMNRVALYRPVGDGAGFERQQIGFTLPFANREIPHPKLLFPIPLPPQVEQTIYLRFQSQTRISLPLTLWTPTAFVRVDRLNQFLWGIYYGVLLIMAGYNLFLFVALRERSTLYLVLFISALLVNVAVSTGRAQEYLGLDLGQLNNWLVLIAGVFTVALLLLFTGSFLETKQRAPGLHRLITFWLILLPALQLAALPFGFRAATNALLLPTIPILVTLVWAGVSIWRQGFRPARYFVLAELIPLLLGIFDILSLLGLLPPLVWFRQTTYVGNVMLVLFMSLALADRINLLKAETEAANRRLSDNERRLNQFLDAVPVGLAIQDSQLRVDYINPHALQILNLPQSVAYSNPEPMSPAENSALFPVFVAGTDQLYPLERQPLGQALQGRSATADDVEIVVNGRRIRLETWSSPVFDEEQQLVNVISAFNDITERKREEIELAQYRDQLAQLVEARTWELLQSNQALRQQRALAESLAEIAAALNRSLDQEIVLTEVLRLLKRVVAYENAGIWLLEGETFTLAKAAGLTEPDFGRAINLGDSPSLATMFQPDHTDSLPKTIIGENNETWLGAPLIAADKAIGVLILNSGQAAYTEDEVKALQAFADYAAVAVVNARLYQQVYTAATVRERERLARELHDAVTQTLFAASIIAEALPLLWQQAPPEAVQNVGKLRQLTRGALAEMRSLLLELRPAALLEARLENLLTHLSEAMTGRTRVPVSLKIEGDLNGIPSPEIKVACYRIAQEAFNNIIKHARATQVKVILCRQPQALLLQIADNGRGFDASAVSADHMGLAIMRERAAAIGAALCIDSRPGQGTEVALQWPAKPEEFRHG